MQAVAISQTQPSTTSNAANASNAMPLAVLCEQQSRPAPQRAKSEAAPQLGTSRVVEGPPADDQAAMPDIVRTSASVSAERNLPTFGHAALSYAAWTCARAQPWPARGQATWPEMALPPPSDRGAAAALPHQPLTAVSSPDLQPDACKAPPWDAASDLQRNIMDAGLHPRPEASLRSGEPPWPQQSFEASVDRSTERLFQQMAVQRMQQGVEVTQQQQQHPLPPLPPLTPSSLLSEPQRQQQQQRQQNAGPPLPPPQQQQQQQQQRQRKELRLEQRKLWRHERRQLRQNQQEQQQQTSVSPGVEPTPALDQVPRDQADTEEGDLPPGSVPVEPPAHAVNGRALRCLRCFRCGHTEDTCTKRVKGASKRRRKALEQAAQRAAEAEEAAREREELRADGDVAVLDSQTRAEPPANPVLR